MAVGPGAPPRSPRSSKLTAVPAGQPTQETASRIETDCVPAGAAPATSPRRQSLPPGATSKPSRRRPEPLQSLEARKMTIALTKVAVVERVPVGGEVAAGADPADAGENRALAGCRVGDLKPEAGVVLVLDGGVAADRRVGGRIRPGAGNAGAVVLEAGVGGKAGRGCRRGSHHEQDAGGGGSD